MIPKLSVRSNLADQARQLGIELKDLPKRAATALTRTALDARMALRENMSRVFDRPTRFTLNSLYVKPATASDLNAVVWLKDRKATGGRHYLEPQIEGGGRPLKAFERRLQRIGVLPVGMYAVPGSGAKIDSYGNLSANQVVQILSQLRAFGEAGYDAHPTGSKRSRRSVKRAGRFFVGRPGGGRLPLGVWRVAGSSMAPVLIFVRAPRYAKRFHFYAIAEKIGSERFFAQLERAHAENSGRAKALAA